MRRSFALLSLFLLAACATIVRGTEQDVLVDTTPSGAQVVFSSGLACTSPCSVAAKRNQNLNVNVSKEGCTNQTAFVRPRISAGGGLLGGLPDYATGAIYDLEPSELSFMLLCTGARCAAPNRAADHIKLVAQGHGRARVTACGQRR